MKYVPLGVPAGRVKVFVALPLATASEVMGVPMTLWLPSYTVKVTVPSLMTLPVLATMAIMGNDWALREYGLARFAIFTVVAAWPIVKVVELSLLGKKV